MRRPKVITDVDVRDAVTDRALVLFSSFERRNTMDGYLYGTHRNLPRNLGWRFEQNIKLKREDHLKDPDRIRAGDFDKEIEETWHEAAEAAHWYKYHKNWGE